MSANFKQINQVTDHKTAIRIMQHRLARAQAAADESTRLYAVQVERANRLEADLIRARSANVDLLLRLYKLQGFVPRRQLAA